MLFLKILYISSYISYIAPIFLLNLYKPSIYDNLNIYRFNIYTYTASIFFSNLHPKCWDFEKEKRAHTRHMDTLPNKMRLVIGTWSVGYSWKWEQMNFDLTIWKLNDLRISLLYKYINEINMGKSSET